MCERLVHQAPVSTTADLDEPDEDREVMRSRGVCHGHAKCLASLSEKKMMTRPSGWRIA
jgi:hypothetical protein